MDSRGSRLVPSDTRTRIAVVLLALAGVLAAVGIALSTGSSSDRDVVGAPETSRTPSPSPVRAPATDPSPSATQSTKARPQGPPTELVVPSLDLSAPVVPIEMDTEGVLTPPGDVDTVGWWQRSAQPGSPEGQTLVTGHSVRLGDGAMDRIGELGRGDTVELRAKRGTTRYRTTKVFTYTRDQVAGNAVELFGQQRRDGRLVLVTCTDWNGSYYESNIIVLAERVDRS